MSEPKKESTGAAGVHEEPHLFFEEEKKIGKGKKKWIFLGILFCLVFAFWPKGKIQGEAILQADKFAKLGLTSSGVLKELYFRKGTRVKKGDLIAKFVNTELLQKFQEKMISLEALQHDRTRLQNKLDFFQKDKDRKQILFENSVIGRAAFEKANLDFVEAQEGLFIREKEKESLELEIQYLKSRVESLEIRAPFDGVLLTDPKDYLGSLLKEGDFVLEIADPESYFLEFLIPEKQVQRVSIGDKVSARFSAFPWKTFLGEVTLIAPKTTREVEKVFKTKRVIACEIKLQGLPANIKYGIQASVKIKPSSARRNSTL